MLDKIQFLLSLQILGFCVFGLSILRMTVQVMKAPRTPPMAMYRGRTESREEIGVRSENSQRTTQVKKALIWTQPAESQMPVCRVSPVFKTP